MRKRKTSPTIKQKRAFNNLTENHGNLGKAMVDAGYSKNTAKKPQNLTESLGWKELVDSKLPDKDLTDVHKELLDARRLDHMVFPPFQVKKEKDEEEDEEETNEGENYGEQLSDKEIRELLASVKCQVRKIVHGETARHVYFWSPDNKAKKDALELAYKIKGRINSGDTPALPPAELHLHLHKNEKVVQIIKTAEESLLSALQGEIQND